MTQHHFLVKKINTTPSPHWIVMGPLLKPVDNENEGFIFELLILCHWCTSLPLCKNPTVYINVCCNKLWNQVVKALQIYILGGYFLSLKFHIIVESAHQFPPKKCLLGLWQGQHWTYKSIWGELSLKNIFKKSLYLRVLFNHQRSLFNHELFRSVHLKLQMFGDFPLLILIFI